MSFHCKMLFNHKDVSKFTNSLLINVNENPFKFFFTDDRIRCFMCS
jgi:hypothetical protein